MQNNKPLERPLRVLMILEYAPDYRESFLKQLAENCDLTVVAQPCESANLQAPVIRGRYKYIEISSRRKFGLNWQNKLSTIFRESNWDVISVSSNLRYVSRIWIYLTNWNLRQKWVWRGQICGTKNNRLALYVKALLFSLSGYVLTYSKIEQERLALVCPFLKVSSFNNTEVSCTEFRYSPFLSLEKINLLFVGRNQLRKKLERLIPLLEELDFINLRLIGPGMSELELPDTLIQMGRIELMEGLRGEALNSHFDWAHLIVSPGHLGLMVLNASRHGKPILIDSLSEHAPEVEVAYAAHQPFIDYSDVIQVKSFFNRIRENPDKLKAWGDALQGYARSHYTIENMVNVHISMFNLVAQKAVK